MQEIYSNRRQELADAIGNGIAVVSAAIERVRNSDVEYEFRQDSDFYFLTGFREPEAVAVLDPHGFERYILFVRPRDRELETWNGYRAGVEGAVETFGADAAYPLDDFDRRMAELLVGREHLYYKWGSPIDHRMTAILRKLHGLNERFGYTIPTTITDPAQVLAEARLLKSPQEAELLREACRISAAGHVEAMLFAQPGLYEYQVQAAMEFVFRQRGSLRNGYPSIVASGANATVLHYTDNDQQMKDGDLLLIDAGAEYGYFSADITRTFPVGGRFTAPQRALYDVVLAAHQSGIDAATEGSTMRRIHEASTRTIAEGLIDLGLLPRGLEDSLAMHHYREFFMHGTGHWLGMDVHDAGAYRTNGEHRSLQAGMAFTIEPGVYVRPDRPSANLPLLEYDLDAWTERRLRLGVAKAQELECEELEAAESIEHQIPTEFLGIGIRIEDDFLLTDAGVENMSVGVPTEPDQIEALASSASALGV